MDSRVDAIVDVCRALQGGAPDEAREALTRRYPFTAPTATPRRYGPSQATQLFIRDGFIDRYSGQRVVFPPVLRVVSLLLPEEFPYHPNWKMDVTHPAYWELTATVDHIVPACRGGADDDQNWVTTSMSRNSAKGNWTLEDLGWELHPAGDVGDWDGLLGWYVEITAVQPELLFDDSMRKWRKAALQLPT